MGRIKFKNKKVELVFTVFAWLSLFCAIIFSVTATISTFSSSTNGRELFGYKVLIVETDSMSKSDISKDEEIFFNAGDVVVIQVLNDYSGIQVGDVITFVSYNDGSRGKTLTHKVRSIRSTASGELIGFETYGINTGVSDQAIVEPEAILGKYVGKVPDLGRLFKFFKTPGGFFLSISVPCLLLIIFFSITVGKQLGKKELSDSYDDQIEKLRNRLLDLEGKDWTVVQMNEYQTNVTNPLIAGQTQEQGEGNMQTNGNETIIENQTQQQEQQPAQQQAQQQSGVGVDLLQGQAQAMYQTYIQQSTMHSEKLTELAFNTLLGTINALTGTIGTLVDKVENPTLAGTIETLTSAMTNMAEKPALAGTVETLTNTMKSMVEKPALSGTVETLTSAMTSMTEKVLEPVIIQPINNQPSESIVETAATTYSAPVVQPEEVPVQTMQKPEPVQTIVEKVIETEVENSPVLPTNDKVVEAQVENSTILPIDKEVVEIEVDNETEVEVEEVELTNETETEVEEFEVTDQTEDEVEEVEETAAEDEVEMTEVESESEFEEATGLKGLTKRKKVPFNKKLLSLTSEKKEFFSDIHNELASYKIKYRISFKGITYRLGRKTLAKITVRGLTLKLHLALDVNEYPETVYFQENLEGVVAYKDVPFTVKIKSNRGKNNAIKLISSLAEKNGLIKKEDFKNENILRQLRLFK